MKRAAARLFAVTMRHTMEQRQQPFRGFTSAEAVELFRRINAANDDGDHGRDPARTNGRELSRSAAAPASPV